MAQSKEEQELLAGFLRETYPMLDELEESILSLEENPKGPQGFTTCLRLLHTIKGTSACLGLTKIADFSHRYESFVNKIKNKDLNQEDIDILLQATDTLKKLHRPKGERFTKQSGEIFDRHLRKRERQYSETKEVGIKRDALVPLKALERFIELSEEATVFRNIMMKTMDKLRKRFPQDDLVKAVREHMNTLRDMNSIQQNEMAKMKQISLEKVFRSLRRFVRDTGKKYKKNVHFIVLGENLMVDTRIGALLRKTLVHIVSNSIYHGIEEKEERLRKGKKEKGNICIRYYEENDNIVVKIEDDGRGIDCKKIVRKALDSKMYTEDELNQMGQEQQMNLIFRPGLSTADQVTTLSGRGVGMDTVNSNVEEMGGKVLLRSESGEGTLLTMIIPIPHSSSVTKTLSVGVKEQIFHIPIDMISEIVSHKMGKTMLLNHDDKLIPLVHLGEYLQLSRNNTEKKEKASEIVIVKHDSFRFGIIVDKIGDIHEIVAKKMDRSCFQGASLGEHGKVDLVLDIDKLGRKNRSLTA